ncbi:MAG: BatD family protein [Lentimonas sp.]
MKFKDLAYSILFLTASAMTHAAITVTAQFQPRSIPLGDKAQYVVSIKETSSSGRPETERITTLPIAQSGGLTLRNGRVSNSQQSKSVNGQAEYSITQNLIIEATAPRVGNYTIPSYVISYKGNNYTAPSATLSVVERPADAPPPVNELVFLKAAAPTELYIGQTAQIALKIYVHEQARYRGYDDFNRNADGFTISDLPEGTESVEVIGDYRYQVITWPLTITPIQSGQLDLNFEFSVVADLPSKQNRRPSFGGSIFNDLFSTRSERFNLFNEPTLINVLPLPETGKPESFSGAVGDFSIQVSTDAKDSLVGEPIMLSLKVSGNGNFDRISGPTLPESTAWRSYKPEASMEASATNPLKGVKRFDYVLIAEQAGKRMLPEVKFSFFDPKEREYVELTSPSIAVDVAPSLQPQLPGTTAPSSDQLQPNQVPSLNKTLSSEEVLLTLDYRPQPSQPVGLAILTQPSFYIFNAITGLALLGAGYLLYKRKRLANDASYASQQAARSELKTALAAAKSADQAEEFFRSAQVSVRLASSLRFKQNLRAAEFTQLEALFRTKSLADDAIDAAQALFKKADSIRFSGGTHATSDLRIACQQLDTILKAL